MCIGVAAKVIDIREYAATVDVMGATMEVGTIFLDNVNVNDYVVVHAGQAMALISEEEALASIETWTELIKKEKELMEANLE